MFNRLLHNRAKIEVVLYGPNVQQVLKVLNIKIKIKNVTLDSSLRTDQHKVIHVYNCSHHTRTLLHTRPLQKLNVDKTVGHDTVTASRRRQRDNNIIILIIEHL